MYSEDYQYVTENLEILLFSGSRKTKRCRVREGNGECCYVWGYQDEDVDKKGIFMSSPAYKLDIEALHGQTKIHPILLLELLKC